MSKLVKVVSGIIENQFKQVLVVRHNKCRGLLMFPVGKIENNETKGEALCRELFEEVGIIPTAFFQVAQIPTWYNRVDGVKAFEENVFMISDYEGYPYNKEPHKHLEILWVDIKDIVANPQEYSYATWNIALEMADRYE